MSGYVKQLPLSVGFLYRARLGPPHHQLVDPLQVFERGELHDDLSPLGGEVDLHSGVEMARQELLQLQDSGWWEPAWCPRDGLRTTARRCRTGSAVSPGPLGLSPTVVLANQVLDGPYGQAFGHHRLGQHLLVAPIGGPEEGTSVARADLAFGQQSLDPRGKLEEPEDVGD